MRTIKRLWLRMKTVGWAVLHDLFGEEDLPGQVPDRGSGSELVANSLMDALSARLQDLQPALAVLNNRLRCAEQERQQAVETLNAQDGEIDRLLRSGQDEQARVLLERRTALAAQVVEVTTRCQALNVAHHQAQGDVTRLREQITAARKKASIVAEQANSAQLIETMQRTQREIERDLSRLQTVLEAEAEQAARRQDRSEAWRDIRG